MGSRFRSWAHLEEQLGPEKTDFLIDPANTGKIKQAIENLMPESVFSTEMTIGGRTYEILSFLKGNEKSVNGKKMVKRAKEMRANLNEDDCRHILEHQDEIPVALRGKVYFIFTDWCHPDDSGRVAGVSWYGSCWILYWYWLDNDWDVSDRVLRRKPE